MRDILIPLCFLVTPSLSRECPKIAVVGAGISGSSAAYFLHNDFGSDCQITVFEPGEIGGRLATTKMRNGVNYEVGGSVIHRKNKFIKELTVEMGLRPIPDMDDVLEDNLGGFSIYGKFGDSVPLFQESRGISFLNKILFVYHYGLLSLWTLYRHVSGRIENLEKVYPYLEEGNYLETTKLAMEFQGEDAIVDTNVSLEKLLKDLRLSKSLITELAGTAVRVNYGQMPDDVHGYVGFISLAGIESGLWSIDGGNKLLPERLLNSSSSKLIRKSVKSIKKLNNGKYQVLFGKALEENLIWKEGSQPFKDFEEDLKIKEFDIVIIAAPQTKDKYPIELLNVKEVKFPGRYHRTVATIVMGKLKKFDTRDNFFIDENSNINSVSELRGCEEPYATDGDTVYKVFSQQPLSEDEMAKLFKNVTEVRVFDWLAYPHYFHGKKVPLKSFELDENLYYTNVWEWAGSAMEMAAISAKNVANMAFHKWYNMSSEGNKSTAELKSEL